MSNSPTLAAAGTAASIGARIALHAASVPDRVAVADGGVSFSFAVLDRRASRLATLLTDAGAGPERCVGLLFERSADFVVAALAVLKTGAAYLPIDSATPADRAAFMLSDAEAPLLLTHRRKVHDCPRGDWRIIEIDDLDLPARESVPVESDPESLAYVIYTSGSSGRPKGVEISHANLLNLIDWHVAAFSVTPADRASQVAGLGFDAAVWEIWPHLAAGASLHIADEVTRRSPQTLRDWLVAQRITISFVPTVLAEQMLHADWPADTSLRMLLTGADVLHRRPATGLPFTLVNNYGPTECTVVATSGVVAPSPNGDGPPSIGHPISNTVALVLDEHLWPVRDGEPGELCLGGALVGRGYRNQPELTASRFVSHSPTPGQSLRVYRTGDRALRLPNGEIAFLGRLDEQIKIRGYRIEPGEIVAALHRYPGVQASAVVALDSANGLALTAYIVAAGNARLTASDLREFLAAHMPDYMIPTQLVKLAALPTTANGKLDRAALPAPRADNLLPNREQATAPSATNSVQPKIAALVASLLDQPTVAADDNFFMIGGHSMLGVQLVARIRELFGVKLTLRQLFGAPTVAGLSAEVARLVEESHV